MNLSLAKLKAIILYFVENTNPQYLGKVKLMKLFYYLDFIHTRKFGAPVTRDQYFHLQNGPIPSSIMNMITELSAEQETSALADDIAITQPLGTRMQKIEALREFNDNDKNLFTATELETLAEVCRRFKDTSTSEIIEESHSEAPWSLTEYGQPIPYEYAAKDGGAVFSEEEIRFLQKVAQ